MNALMHTVSVIAPCRNECGYVEGFCESVLAQLLPEHWELQLVIADGLSDDGTREVLERLAAVESRIQVINNPQRIASAGLNCALKTSVGNVIVRMDIHTVYAPDYIAQCIALLTETGADNVGGPWLADTGDGASSTQRAVAAAFQSRWVAGGALSRRIDYNGWVDTVYLGCWPRKTFERFGGFDEMLVRNQDDEHNLRIVQGGGRIWQSSRIRSTYRPRNSLAQVFRQYLQYGYWKPFVMKKHGQPASVRHLLPAAFVALCVILTVVVLVGAPIWPLAALLSIYLACVAAMTVVVARGLRGFAGAVARVPAVIVAYHVAYGVGSLIGWWDAVFHGKGRVRFATLTR